MKNLAHNWVRTQVFVGACLVIGFAMVASAQQVRRVVGPQPMPEGHEARIIELRYDNMDVIQNILQTFNPQGLTITAVDEQVRIIGIHGPPDVLDVAEEYVQKYDVKRDDVEFMMYLIEASTNGSKIQLPDEIADVVDELKKVFAYNSFRLLDTILLRVSDGRYASTNGVLLVDVGTDVEYSQAGEYALELGPVRVSNEDSSSRITVDGFELTLTQPQIMEHTRDDGTPAPRVIKHHNAHINTSVDVTEGRKIVVGKANVEASSKALFVVLTARVVD